MRAISRRSAAAARMQPPAIAWPLTAATTGLSSEKRVSNDALIAGRNARTLSISRTRRAMSSAMRSPAIRLVGSARPVPTMSSAVPWSGEVRTKGRPSVTLTPPAKSTVLIGISAWS